MGFVSMRRSSINYLAAKLGDGEAGKGGGRVRGGCPRGIVLASVHPVFISKLRLVGNVA